ncbi:MAG: YtzH-like family protein [Bacilli bacterium]
MPLSHTHQMQLIKDILLNHSQDCCGTVSECEQVERVVKNLLTNEQVPEDVKNTLREVYFYSQKGKYSPDLDQHISNHQGQLTSWVDGMNTFQ